MTGAERKRAAIAGLFLFLLNAWISHRLFTAEFLGFQSNEAAFISLGRFYRDHWRDLRWFPLFDCGMPIENAYQPLLPALTAVVGTLAGLPISRAFHLVMAFAYCLGPVTLAWCAWEWSGAVLPGLFAGLFYSLISPAAIAFAPIRAISGGWWVPQRLFNIVFYGEDPHNVALTLLPVALVFLRRLALRRSGPNFIGAVLFSAAVVATNAFGAIDVALGALCVCLALRRGFGALMAAGVVAWCWISPWITPSLLATIRSTAMSQRGQYSEGMRSAVAMGILVCCFGALVYLSRKLASPFERFACLMAPWMCGFPLAFYAAGTTLVPQPHRYQLEFEMAVCLLLAAGAVRIVGSCRERPSIAVGLGLAAGLLAVHQIRAYGNFAHSLIRPVNISQTAEYRLAERVAAQLPGRRTMVSGDAAWLFNTFSDSPQMSGGHDASTPNFIQQVAVYQLYTGMNAGVRDAEVSVMWLKSFGAAAVTVPGQDSQEIYKPYVNPEKFAGVLPVLWSGNGDTVYAVPSPSASLARVVPRDAVVARAPVNGLDLERLRPYVAALDDPAMPLAEIAWTGLSKGTIHARMSAGEAISLQMNYNPAWRARVAGKSVAVRRDGLGLMAIDPGCAGDCTIEIEFAVTTEMWTCRALSALASLLLVALGFYRPAGSRSNSTFS